MNGHLRGDECSEGACVIATLGKTGTPSACWGQATAFKKKKISCERGLGACGFAQGGRVRSMADRELTSTRSALDGKS